MLCFFSFFIFYFGEDEVLYGSVACGKHPFVVERATVGRGKRETSLFVEAAARELDDWYLSAGAGILLFWAYCEDFSAR